MNREAIYSALFGKFSPLAEGEAALFRLATRKVKTWEDYPREDMPVLLMRQLRERPERLTGRPTKWYLDVLVMIYAYTGAQTDGSIVPMQVLNPLLDVITAALPIDDPIRQTCTLGGLVYSCAITGEIQIFPGDLGDDAVALIPVEIVTAA